MKTYAFYFIFPYVGVLISFNIFNVHSFKNEISDTSRRNFTNEPENRNEAKLEILEQTVEALQVQMRNLTRSIKDISRDQIKIKDNHVVFYARLSSTIILNTYSIVKFNDVVINVGNHYNSGDGIFVAPVAGVYQFSWMTLTDSGDHVYTELRVDNVVIDKLAINLGSAAGTIPATRVTVCKVEKGDHVWIQTTGTGGTNFFVVGSAAHSSFMGLLLFET
ncbi:complement C1q-like protein 3 [Mytilus trossulus]|uniref:complement C1q-like protein 3 n=1 Tax=Mytilus trossulus TaxID=6551 RepID=UPI0030074259